MKKKFLFGIIFMLLVLGVYVFTVRHEQKEKISANPAGDNVISQNVDLDDNDEPTVFAPEKTPAIAINGNKSNFSPPMDRASERITKKPFGMYITPATSPVQPDKFQGFHTGTDFEIFPEEIREAVAVKAICSGKIIIKKSASGYGGVLVQECENDKKAMTVVYGHLKLSSISKKVGDNLSAGETLGVLGDDKSAETDGARKHLHLSVHKSAKVDILGYVQNKSALSDWLDPCQFICN